jgi:iron complex transport system substrate-binding protein
MARDRDLDLVPRDREIGVVADLLGRLDEPAYELHRADEVAPLEGLLDRVAFAPPPIELGQPRLDCVIVEQVQVLLHEAELSRWPAGGTVPGAIVNAMRIASLVPSATEMLYALDLGERVVAVTHECDHPPEVAGTARLTRSVVPDGLAAGQIDAAVRELTAEGRALYELDEQALARLDVDLIVTQALCAVCAVSYDDVRAVAGRLHSRPDVLSLDPVTLEQVLDDVVRLADATGEHDRGVLLRARLERRLQRVRDAVAGAARRRVLALEWLDPPFVGGHWVPQMIDAAGGFDPIGEPGRRSRVAEWEQLRAVRPEVVVVMPCGLYADEALRQGLDRRDQIDSLGAERVVAVDAAASFSRPGPRLVDGVELLAHLLHPEQVSSPPGIGWRPVAVEAPA